MDYDLTEAADKIAEKIWDARLGVHLDVPYAELSVDKQNKIKESILPVMFYAFPIVEEFVREKFQKDTDALNDISAILSGDGLFNDTLEKLHDLKSISEIVASTGRSA